jgi:23S rRNA pseudouridine1911/1915/1917 synthase
MAVCRPGKALSGLGSRSFIAVEDIAIQVKMPDHRERFQSFDRERRRPEPEPVALTILYEDDAIIALDKPAGMVVHPTYKNTSGTLLNGVLWRFRDRPTLQPGILTRLDKGTSGIVLVALTPALHARMQKQRMQKEYLAVVAGMPDPPRGAITLPLARAAEDRRRVVVTGGGAPCETRYEVLSHDDDRAVVRCEPITGRTHQIRVHLAAIGCPVVGDAVYGQPNEAIARQALHAWRLSLAHPVTRERLQLESPLPPDIRALV